MTARNTDTKEEILRIGKELIKLYGYNAFSYADISRELNMKNAAVHYHYRNKEDLLDGILQSYIDDYVNMGKQLDQSGLSAVKKIEKFIEKYSHLVESNSICIIGSVASDYNTLPDSVKEKTAALINLVLTMVEKILNEGKKKGELDFPDSPKTQTLLMMTNLAAGVQLARISGKKDYEAIRKSLIRQIST